MRNIFFAALIALTAFSVQACASMSGVVPGQRTEVVEVSRRIAERYASTWNANDMAGFGGLYASDARHVTMGGDFLRGRSAIVAAHRANRASYAQGVRMVTLFEGARAITDDTIVSVMRVEYVGTPGGTQAARLTLTLVHNGGDWQIAQAQASQPTDITPRPAPSAPPSERATPPGR